MAPAEVTFAALLGDYGSSDHAKRHDAEARALRFSRELSARLPQNFIPTTLDLYDARVVHALVPFGWDWLLKVTHVSVAHLPLAAALGRLPMRALLREPLMYAEPPQLAIDDDCLALAVYLIGTAADTRCNLEAIAGAAIALSRFAPSPPAADEDIAVIEAAVAGSDKAMEAARTVEQLAHAAAAKVSRQLEALTSGEPSAVERALARRYTTVGAVHGYRRLGGHHIDDMLANLDRGDGSVLRQLISSGSVVPGRPEQSRFLRHISVGGAMAGVFTETEVAGVRAWVQSSDGDTGVVETSATGLPTWWPSPPPSEPSDMKGRVPDIQPRPLFHRLISDRDRAAATQDATTFLDQFLQRTEGTTGLCDVPAEWDEQVFRDWFEARYFDQVASYDAMKRNDVTREEVTRDLVQDAPFALVDGSWLQGIARIGAAIDPFRRSLIETFWDEIGAGDAAANHPNLFRVVLQQALPDVAAFDAPAFAADQRFTDEAFQLAVLLLAYGQATEPFFPELVGFNAAIELSGVGGPFLAGAERLRSYGFDSRYLDVHNVIDNFAMGHSRWALEAVVAFMRRSSADGTNIAEQWNRVRRGFASFLLGRRDLGEAKTALAASPW